MKHSSFTARIAPGYEMEISSEYLKSADIELVSGHRGEYHILHEGRSFNVILESIDKEASIYHLRVNGTSYAVDIKDSWDRLIHKMGLDRVPETRMSELLSPMPGQVKKVLVKPGDEIEEGELLLNVEAMKMENQLKAAHAAIVKAVNVAEGDVVQKGQVLVEFE